MEYSQAQTGRVFVMKVNHGENIINSLEVLAKKENLTAATIHLLGACAYAELVIGPEDPTLPPKRYKEFIKNNASEFLGFGTIFLKDNKPNIHIHISLGNKTIVKTGHLLNNHEVFIISEVIITELLKCSATRVWDETMQLHLLSIEK